MPSVPRRGAGLGLAVLSAAAFGTSGSFATSLINAGWSPAAAVTARILTAGAVLTIPAFFVLRGRWALLVSTSRSSVVYGLFAVAGAQLCFFNAISYLSVGVALLLEYLGTLLVVGWLWLRHAQRPGRLTTIGAAAAAVGLVLVLDVTGRHHLDPIGVLWGLGAAIGLAVYFVLSANADDALPPIAMAWAGMMIGGLFLLVAGVAGAFPMQAHTGDAQLLHHRLSWLVPVIGLSLIAAVLAYTAGIDAARLLGARLASFVGLGEVLFAVLFAWLFLGQLPRGVQILGGVFIVGGVALVRIDEQREPGPDLIPIEVPDRQDAHAHR